ncbi:MAG: flagellin [Pirellulales bacterium]
MLNILNGSGAEVLASINEDGTGINIRSRLSGADFSIGENGGTTASQLGLRTFLPTNRLSDLNHGLGVHMNAQGPEFQINRADGTVLVLDLDDAQTVQDVLDKINNHPANQDPTLRVTARLSTFGNGIELVDNGVGGTMSIERMNNSVAADDLGLLSVGVDRLSATVTGGAQAITGRDVSPQETDSAFNGLIRMRDALRANDQLGLTRSFGLVDDATGRVTYARAELGARQQALDILQSRLDDEDTVLKASLSDEIETDMTTAISDLLQRQAAMQASLQLMAQTTKLSLLDYL